jgi:hypothetical protein
LTRARTPWSAAKHEIFGLGGVVDESLRDADHNPMKTAR